MNDPYSASADAGGESSGGESSGGESSGSDIAVVGLAGRFPGAGSIDELWRLLREGRRGIRSLSSDELRAAGVDEATLRDPSYVPVGAPLDGVDLFDAGFFGFSPRDAAIMDPQHRNFIESAWEALEAAGHVPERFPGAIGVFAGCGMQAYLVHNLLTNPELVRSVGMFLLRHTGNDKDFLTTRASYLLDLTGPSVSVQTACSTSLVAIHLACQSLLSGECDLALAGGVTIEVPHGLGYHYREGEILAPDGHCRAFDARAAGTVFGSGVGVVALRRLADALADGDTIRAVVKGSAINNDGALKAGYLAPSVEGQARAIAEALAVAGVAPESIGYVEAHGTGTPVGDPIEVAALTRAFGSGTDWPGPCRIGSIKPSIGHLDTAAGVASFIKATLALEHAELPASLDFEAPNPEIAFADGPFVVNDRLTSWTTDGAPRRAGVNSLGVGGTNAFVVLEEPPVRPPAPRARPYELLALSAKTPAALDAQSRRLADHLRAHPDANLADVAYTLQVGRKAFEHRRIVAARDVEDAVEALDGRALERVATGERPDGAPLVAFMFAGGGAQYSCMGREAYATEPVYRAALDECLALLSADRADELRRVLCTANVREIRTDALESPARGLPALFATQYALAQLWRAWGVEPAAMIGHSVGEYAAACLAGVLSLEDALALVVLRGELFETLPPGGMTSVHLTESELRPLLRDALSLAAVNAPDLCVASGPVDALADLERELERRDVPYGRLHIAVAAHSTMVEPILDQFERWVARARPRAPTIPYVSTLTGTWITPEQVTDPRYWSRHLREPVRFAEGIATLLGEPSCLFVEVGPGQALTSLVRQQPAAARAGAVVPSLPRARDDESDAQTLLTSLGRLWVAGLDVDWPRLHAGHGRRRLPLPTYPFERRRHWIEPGRAAAGAVALPEPSAVAASGEPVAERSLAKQASLDDWFYRPVWRRAARDEVPKAEPLTWLLLTDADPAGAILDGASSDPDFDERVRPGSDVAGGEDLGARLARRLGDMGHAVTTVSMGAAFAGDGAGRYVLDPGEREHWDRLIAGLQASGRVPDRIVHLWSFAPDTAGSPRAGYERTQARGFYGLLHLAQAIGDAGLDAPIHLGVVTSGLRAVDGEAVLAPERATLDGPVRVIPRELPNVSCQTVDVDLPTTERAPADLADRLVAELARPLHEPSVALRGGDRWTEAFERVAIRSHTERTRLRERGTYLITGGLGGIGLTLAEYLARTVRARLVLVGRAGLPERDRWDALLATLGPREPTRRAIEQVRALEATGADVLVLRADVADPEQVARVVGQATARFGPIQGVIHAAGVLDDAPLQLKDREAAERVLAPKVRGTLALDAALSEQPLDFALLCSSTSAILGQAGQIDYAAANAFLDAFAASKQSVTSDGGARAGIGDGPTWISVAWGVWQDVGMTTPSSDARHAELDVSGSCLTGPIVHPLLGVRERDEPDRTVYRAEYDPEALWPLDEHRLRPDGVAVLPGASYLGMARAAIGHRANGRGIEVCDLVLLAPLVVRAKERHVVRVTLEREAAEDGYGLVVESVAHHERGASTIEHARGTVRFVADEPSPTLGVPTVPMPPAGADTRATKQDRVIGFGPRWQVIQDYELHGGAALARLVLPERFAADLDAYPLHPALLDMATTIGLPLIPGYADADDFYVPLSWERARLHAPLTRTLLSRATLREGVAAHGLAVFDVTVADEHGAVLVEVDGLALTRVDPARLLGGERGVAAVSAQEPPGARPRGLLGDLLAEGIRPSEGAEVFARILAGGLPRVVATSVDLHALIDRAGASATPTPDPFPRSPSRPGHVGPRTDVERRLAALWRELLGVAEVGVHDDFFELGGHSLIAVRLLTRVRKAFGVDLALDTLFRASTIAACAEIVERRRDGSSGTRPDAVRATGSNGRGPHGAAANTDAPSGAASPAQTNGALAMRRSSRRHGDEDAWSPLVRIQAGTTLPPFFCVHAIGGNVVVFRDLAARLGPEQPFYGVQARGVDGRLKPLSTIDEMATLYLAQIREVRPHGPYLLGGYSGGGIVAYEMAQRLLRGGEVVGLLALLDAYPRPIPWGTGKGFRRNLLEQGVRYLPRAARTAASLSVVSAARARVAAYERLGRTLPLGLRGFWIAQAMIPALDAYHPEPYPGRIALFRAAETDGLHRADAPDQGWGELARGGVEVYDIPGVHGTFVLEPNVQVLAEHLRACLDRARAAGDARALAR